VYEVHSRDEFFRAYDQSLELCMIYQKAVNYEQYFRCYVVGQKKVRVMTYDPRRPHSERYLKEPPEVGRKLLRRIEQDARKLCAALGYDMNTVEFAVEKGIPYAIDFMNPVPDADVNSVGEANFEWIVRETANLAIAKARKAPQAPDLRCSTFLGSEPPKTKPQRKKKTAASRKKPAADSKPRRKKS
jgi:hypothetical protein